MKRTVIHLVSRINNAEVPIYSTHNVVEPLGCKSDVTQCEEFYVDEYILPNYKDPIKIEAGLYSHQLVSYLINDLNMPSSRILQLRDTHQLFFRDHFLEAIFRGYFLETIFQRPFVRHHFSETIFQRPFFRDQF